METGGPTSHTNEDNNEVEGKVVGGGGWSGMVLTLACLP
jgi:hypothetical protein